MQVLMLFKHTLNNGFDLAPSFRSCPEIYFRVGRFSGGGVGQIRLQAGGPHTAKANARPDLA